MASKFKLKTNYRRCTRPQLITTIKRYQAYLYTVANAPEWKTFNGKTPIQHGRAIKKHLKSVSQFLRAKTIAEIDARIKFLTKQMAVRVGIPATSTLAISPAVVRLKAKRRQIASATKISQLVSLVKPLKVAQFKNPKNVSKVTTSSYTRTRRYGKKSAKRTSYTTSKVGGKATTKYKAQTKKLKREIKTLKTRNAVLLRQVVKFRQEVAKMQRHYSTLNRTAPSWRVVSGSGNVGKEVSNIVRISNALNSALGQRKVG